MIHSSDSSRSATHVRHFPARQDWKIEHCHQHVSVTVLTQQAGWRAGAPWDCSSQWWCRRTSVLILCPALPGPDTQQHRDLRSSSHPKTMLSPRIPTFISQTLLSLLHCWCRWQPWQLQMHAFKCVFPYRLKNCWNIPSTPWAGRACSHDGSNTCNVMQEGRT